MCQFDIVAALVITAGLVMHDANDVGEHGVAHAARRGCACAPGVEPGHGHTDDAAGDFGWEALAHDLGDDLPSPFGSVWAFNSSLARFVTASSVSSSRIRLRADANATDSAVVTPARKPRSTRSWFRQI